MDSSKKVLTTVSSRVQEKNIDHEGLIAREVGKLVDDLLRTPFANSLGSAADRIWRPRPPCPALRSKAPIAIVQQLRRSWSSV